MEKKISTPSKNKYYSLNPYNGGAIPLTYKKEELTALVSRDNFLRTQDDMVLLIIKNPVHLN